MSSTPIFCRSAAIYTPATLMRIVEHSSVDGDTGKFEYRLVGVEPVHPWGLIRQRRIVWDIVGVNAYAWDDISRKRWGTPDGIIANMIEAQLINEKLRRRR